MRPPQAAELGASYGVGADRGVSIGAGSGIGVGFLARVVVEGYT